MFWAGESLATVAEEYGVPRGAARRRGARRVAHRCVELVGAKAPFVFVDRSLGRIEVPRLLRAGGIELVTLAEHYGRPADESVDDPTWITDASERGWILFMKDARIRRRPAEKQAIVESRARCFCLSDGNLNFATMAERYLATWGEIVEASAQPGPYLYSVRAREIARLDID